MRSAEEPAHADTSAGPVRAVVEKAAEVSAWAGSSAERMKEVPEGVLQMNQRGRPWVAQRPRPRRNRKSEAVRRMVRENMLTAADFIYPLFIHDELENAEIASMPGCERHSLQSMLAEAKEAR